MQVVLRSPNISSLAKIVSTQYLISSYDPGHYQINVALKSLIEILFSLSINPANNNRHVRNVQNDRTRAILDHSQIVIAPSIFIGKITFYIYIFFYVKISRQKSNLQLPAVGRDSSRRDFSDVLVGRSSCLKGSLALLIISIAQHQHCLVLALLSISIVHFVYHSLISLLRQRRTENQHVIVLEKNVKTQMKSS